MITRRASSSSRAFFASYQGRTPQVWTSRKAAKSSHCRVRALPRLLIRNRPWYWPLLRYDPVARADGGNPFLLDSPRPRLPLTDYAYRELRYRALGNADPAEAERLMGLAQEAVDQRWAIY